MNSTFPRIIVLVAAGLALASCGGGEPLRARDFFAGLEAQNIAHEVQQRPGLTGYELFFEVCLGAFTERQDCFADSFYVLQFNTAESGWRGALSETVENYGGGDFARTNRNLVLAGYDPRRLSAEMMRVIGIFEDFG